MVKDRLSLRAVALLVFLALLPSAAAADGLRLSTGMIEPWTDAAGTGFHQMLIREVFARIGLQAEVELNTASSRAFRLADDGVTDGLAGRVAGIEGEYPNLIRVPERMFVNDFVACSLEGKPLPAPGWEGLVPRSVAYIIGWQVFEHRLPPVRELTLAKDSAQLLTLLKAGRAEVILHERWQALSHAKALGLQLHVQEPPLARVPMYIYLHRRHAGLVDKVADSLRRMKADGSYDAIAQGVFGHLGGVTAGVK